MEPRLAWVTPEPDAAVGGVLVRTGGQAIAQEPKHVLLLAVSVLNAYTVKVPGVNALAELKATIVPNVDDDSLPIDVGPESTAPDGATVRQTPNASASTRYSPPVWPDGAPAAMSN